jgi:glutamyl-tRNA reductase
MPIILIGANYRTAAVEFRGKLTSLCQAEGVLAKLTAEPPLSEIVILSTCNRNEIYAVVEDISAGEFLIHFLADSWQISPQVLGKYLYRHEGEAAVKHLFQVASSLDSMVVGEPQILGQVKEAYFRALENKSTGRVLNRLFHQAIEVGKRVRTETRIAERAVSVSYAGVELAKKVLGGLKGHTILVIGAGKTSELTVKLLVANGASAVMVTNRSYQRAMELAKEFQGKAIRLDDILTESQTADIIISSTSAPHYVLSQEDMRRFMSTRGGRELFIIDLAVPRDIDPKAAELEGISLYNIDDLQSVVEDNLAQRLEEARKAEQIIEQEVERFFSWYRALEALPTISALKRKAEAIRVSEMRKTLSTLNLPSREAEKIDILTRSILNKLLHEPITRIKESRGQDDGNVILESLRYLFALEEERGDKDEARRGDWEAIR